MDKTNVMRILEQKKIAYAPHVYEPAFVDGVSVAQRIGKQTECVFKTLPLRIQEKILFLSFRWTKILTLRKPRKPYRSNQ